MAGYHGYSMSNNAIDAYNEGQMPISKWTKAEILNAISEYLEEDNEKIAMFKKLKLKELKDNFLARESYHHTSKYYNATDFYSIDYYNVDSYIAGDYILANTETVKAPEEKIEIEFAVWGGSRKHPKIVDWERMIGVRKGDWCVNESQRKKITGNYVKVLRVIEN